MKIYMQGLIVLMILAMLAIAAPAQETVQTVDGSAKLLDTKGEVRVQLPQQSFVPASREMTLPPGSTITTEKGSALLLLSDGSQILVKNNSNVVLKSPEQTGQHYLEVLMGRIRAAVTKRIQGAQPFRLGTPSAVITVRGTKFEVSVNKRLVTQVEVFEGIVEVAGFGPGAPVTLRPGYFTQVPQNHAPEQPRSMDPSGDRPGSNRETEGRDSSERSGNGRNGDSENSRSSSSEDSRQQQRAPAQSTERHGPDN
jgi:ferric-dicitrate binding protein FerR (iron transport regulator)